MSARKTGDTATRPLSPAEKRRRARDLLAERAAAGGTATAPSAAGCEEGLELLRIIEHRRAFPGLQEHAYFNYGAHGPMPGAGLEALLGTYEDLGRWGPFSTEANLLQERVMSAARETVATEVGCPPADLAFAENVSVGCNIALWGVDWQRGEHLVLTDAEHPSVGAVALELERRLGIEVSYVPAWQPGSTLVERLERAIRPATRMMVASHVLWGVGAVVDVASIVELCRARSASGSPLFLLVDGAQSAGLLPLDLARLGVDFYAFSGHKWLCGPAGVAGLYVRPEARAAMRPTFLGWRGLDLAAPGRRLEPRADARRFEIGTSAAPLFEAWRAAVATHRAWGSSRRRYERAVSLARRLWAGLRRLAAARGGAFEVLATGAPAAGLVAIRLRSRSHQALVRWLEARRFLARVMADPECVRFSVHYLTLASEIDGLLDAVGRYPFTKRDGDGDPR